FTLQEVYTFYKDYQWLTEIHSFVQSWSAKQLEDMRGWPAKRYLHLLQQLSAWREQVAQMPPVLLTQGRLLRVDCLCLRDIGEESRLPPPRPTGAATVWAQNGEGRKSRTGLDGSDCTIPPAAQLEQAKMQSAELEEQVDYVRSLNELCRSCFNLFGPEEETMETNMLDLWEAFLFERDQASEFLLSRRHSIVLKLLEQMTTAMAELEALIHRATTGPFLDPTQDPRNIERELIGLDRQFHDIVSRLLELHQAYTIFTGRDQTPSRPRALTAHLAPVPCGLRANQRMEVPGLRQGSRREPPCPRGLRLSPRPAPARRPVLSP
uniref:Uncharacterized protein n=1 Tax=Ornithorhynchus anatinus TaxID=9258 RepID=A0A6I8N1W0_ORNAN